MCNYDEDLLIKNLNLRTFIKLSKICSSQITEDYPQFVDQVGNVAHCTNRYWL
jgi:hypothetical protein